MDLTNKTICFLGDSITEGVGASNVSNCYVSLIEKVHPEAKVLNFGICGTRLAEQNKIPYDPEKPYFDIPFYDRVDKMPADSDVICIFGGTNDYGHGDAGMGKFGDTKPNTFYGALYDLSIRLITRCPNAKIIFFTPLHRENEDIPHAKLDGKEYVLKDYINAIKQNCEYFAIPVLDLFTISGIQPNVPLLKERYTPDGLHPNDNGYIVLANIIDAYLKTL